MNLNTGGGGFGGGVGGIPNCARGGGAARLLREAVPRLQEEEQQLRRGYQDDDYLQFPPIILSAQTLYPAASVVPLAEDPPMDDTARQFFCAVLAQASICLPGDVATSKHGVTTPDEVMKFVMEGGASNTFGETPATTSESGQAKEIVLQNILFSVQACEKNEVVDAVLQLDYWLSAIKLACLANK